MIQEWLARPMVRWVDADPETLSRALRLLDLSRASGDLAMDAEIAALALQHDAVVHTADADFARLPGVRWYNPILGTSGR